MQKAPSRYPFCPTNICAFETNGLALQLCSCSISIEPTDEGHLKLCRESNALNTVMVMVMVMVMVIGAGWLPIV